MLEIAQQTLHAVRDIPHVDLTHFDLAPQAISLLGSAVAERYRVAPVMLWHDAVVIAVAELPDKDALRTALRSAATYRLRACACGAY